MDPSLPGVSVAAPIQPAIDRMMLILFRPFVFDKWIAIGFCAWLACFGQGGGSGFGGNHKTSVRNLNLGPARAYVHQNLYWIAPVAVALIVIVLFLAVFFLWLRSRGTFMLLYCIALNCSEVAIPWRKYARQARSLWLFKLAVAGIGLLLMLPLVVVMLWTFYDMFGHGQRLDAGKILIFAGIGLAWICFGLPLSIVNCLTSHFVAPVMYMRGGTCMEAWREFLPVLEANGMRFILYLLFQIVIGILVFFFVIAFCICTCCIGLLLLMIPFLGTVVRLPIIVGWRSYTLYYLAQYGPEFDIFRPPELLAPPPIPAA